ncbi:MAG: cyclic nucleotide-binding domain-containing protein [Desulfuromonadales bacterium]|jgi:CRP/FNR family transcriptional regulator, cyclic AMP receptor protein
MTTLQPFEGPCLGKECPPRLCQQMKRELGFFSFFAENEMEDLSRHFNCRSVPAKTNLWESGDPCEYIGFIVSGKVQIKVDTEFPGKQVVVGVFTRGAVIGTSCAVDDAPRNSTATAMEDTGLILITHDNFTHLIEHHPQLGTRLLKGMLLSESTRLQQAYARLASIF